MLVKEAAKGLDEALAPRSQPMVKLHGEIAKMAHNKRRILLHGPTGSGKECLARFYAKAAVERGSIDGTKIFMAENCACLGTLAHSELFGHEPNICNDVIREQKGAFELCKKGILFLDEIGDLPTEIQPLMLRALNLELGNARHLGGKEDYDTRDVVVISATNRDLKDIRHDLLERLGHVIEVPGLRERPEEIEPALCSAVKKALRSRCDFNKCAWVEAAIEEVARAIASQLEADAKNHVWEGNFRSLNRETEWAVTMASLASETVFVENTVRSFKERIGKGSARRSSAAPPLAAGAFLESLTGEEKKLADRVAAAFRDKKKIKKEQIDSIAKYIVENGEEEITPADLRKAVPELGASTARNRIGDLAKNNVLSPAEGKGRYKVAASAEIAPVSVRRPSSSKLTPKALDTVLSPDVEAALETAQDYLEKGRNAYVSASPGAGKTTLGKAIAERFTSSRMVFWWAFPKDPMKEGGIGDLLAALETEIAQYVVEPSEIQGVWTTQPLEHRVLRLTGFFSHLGSGKVRPLLILDDVEHIARNEHQDALERMLEYWWDTCQVVLLGQTMPLDLELIPPRARPIECRLAAAGNQRF